MLLVFKCICTFSNSVSPDVSVSRLYYIKHFFINFFFENTSYVHVCRIAWLCNVQIVSSNCKLNLVFFEIFLSCFSMSPAIWSCILVTVLLDNGILLIFFYLADSSPSNSFTHNSIAGFTNFSPAVNGAPTSVLSSDTRKLGLIVLLAVSKVWLHKWWKSYLFFGNFLFEIFSVFTYAAWMLSFLMLL